MKAKVPEKNICHMVRVIGSAAKDTCVRPESKIVRQAINHCQLKVRKMEVTYKGIHNMPAPIYCTR